MEIREPQTKISRRALTVWRITGFLYSLIFWAICVTGIVLICVFHLNKWWIVLGLTLLILYTIIFVVFVPKVRWGRWRYEVREKEIELQHGVWLMKRTLIPMIRVQHVDTAQGPILRKYRLATITVSTAATVHEIPAIDMLEADQLRHSISALARVDEDDV